MDGEIFISISILHGIYVKTCSRHALANVQNSFADLGALGNYPGSPFLPSDSEILLDSPEQEDIGNENCRSCFWFWWLVMGEHDAKYTFQPHRHLNDNQLELEHYIKVI